MMGLMYLFAFIIYIVLFIGVVMGAIKVAKTKGKSKMLWGCMAAFIMYNLVFWDFLPTLLLHQYYCKKEAGFWVYKTAEQWRKENPDVVVGPVRPPEGMVLDIKGNGKMMMKDGGELKFTAGKKWPGGHGYNESRLSFYKIDGDFGHWINDRFIDKKINEKNSFLPVRISTESIVDGVTGEVLVKRITIGSGYREEGKRYIRFWTNLPECGPKIDKTRAVYNAFGAL